MVVGVYANFFEVVVFARDAQALLRVSNSAVLWGLVTQEEVLELVHARIGKHEGRVVLDNHWG